MHIPEKCLFFPVTAVICKTICSSRRSQCLAVAKPEVSEPSPLRQVVPTSGPIRGSTMVTVCGRNFGFDKTESFKTSLVTVEVGGAPCKLPRQDYVNRCVASAGRRGSSQLQVPRPWNLQSSSRGGAWK